MKTRRHLVPLLLLAGLPLMRSAAADALPADSAPPGVPAAAAKSKSKTSAPGVPAAPPPLSPRFQQIRDRIDALLHARLETPPPPDPRFNPFRLPGSAPLVASASPSSGKETPAAATLSTDLALLQQAVAMLKIVGHVELRGRFQVVINSGPAKDSTYKERDVINVVVDGQPVHVRVRQITATSIMFSLNDAEMTVKF